MTLIRIYIQQETEGGYLTLGSRFARAKSHRWPRCHTLQSFQLLRVLAVLGSQINRGRVSFAEQCLSISEREPSEFTQRARCSYHGPCQDHLRLVSRSDKSVCLESVPTVYAKCYSNLLESFWCEKPCSEARFIFLQIFNNHLNAVCILGKLSVVGFVSFDNFLYKTLSQKDPRR